MGRSAQHRFLSILLVGAALWMSRGLGLRDACAQTLTACVRADNTVRMVANGKACGKNQTAIPLSGLSAVWSTTGNAGTVAGTNFLGTTDSQPLELFTRSAQVMRYEPANPSRNANGSASPNLIGGDGGNFAAADVQGAVIGGGGGLILNNPDRNGVGADFGTIGGGAGNQANGIAATVGGGWVNNAGGLTAEVAGGKFNTASGDYSSVGGGENNLASGQFASVAGGGATVTGNTASGIGAAVGGGSGNTASGDYTAIPGGSGNIASQSYSFAGGCGAQALNSGSFVWSSDCGAGLSSVADDDFSVLSLGGARFITQVEASDGRPTAGVTLAAGGGSWASISDRESKQNLRPVNSEAIVRKLAALPLDTWSYKAQKPSIRHIGPMAQDFHAAFNVGEDNKHITTLDSEGVALAGIQGLYQMLQQKDAELHAQQAEIARLNARLDRLERQSRRDSPVRRTLAPHRTVSNAPQDESRIMGSSRRL